MRLFSSPKALAAVALAFALRAALVIRMGPDPRYAMVPDAVGYLQAARNLAEHGTFSLSEAPPLVPDTVRTPGYPLLLAATGPSAWRALWVQAALGAASVALVYAAGVALWGSEAAALLAALGLAVDPVTVLNTGLLGTETVFVFCFCAAFLLFARAFAADDDRPGPWAAAGLLFGLCPLVRPAGLYFFVFGAAAMLVARGRRALWKPTAAFVLAALIGPAAWMARNKAALGTATFSSIQGLNIFGMRAAAVEMRLTGQGFDQALASVQEQLRRDHPQPFSSVEEQAAYSGRWAERFILSHPLAYGEEMAVDTVKMLGGHGLEIAAWGVLKDPRYDPMHPLPASGHFSGTRALLSDHPGLAVPLVLYLLFLAAVYALAARGAWSAWRCGQRASAAAAVSPIAYFIAVSAGAMAYYRFRLPLMPAVFLLAGRGLCAGGYGALPASPCRAQK